jgi:hypothetical protein
MNVLSNGRDIFLKFLLPFLPLRVAVNTVKIRLSTVGTYEGHELIFLSELKRALPVQDLYTKSFDYALRNLEFKETTKLVPRSRVTQISRAWPQRWLYFLLVMHL